MRCCLCGSSQVTYLIHHLDFSGVDIYWCEECQYGFASPETDPELLASYYRDTYSMQRQHYLNASSYYVLMQHRAHAQINFLKQTVPAIPLQAQQWQVLDWGCGIGALVTAFCNEGMQAIGYDYDPSVIKCGRSLWNANIHLAPRHFDDLVQQHHLLCLSHVIEHLDHLQASVLTILTWLHDEGYVFIEVPAYSKSMFQGNVATESHLHFFTRRSLIRFLERLPLRVITCLNCGPPVQKVGKRSLLSRVVRKFQTLWQAANKKDEISTMYDGFYETYYPESDERGIWLRCLAQKTNS